MIQAYLVNEPHIMRTKLYIVRSDNGGKAVWDGVEWVFVQEGVEFPLNVGIEIPQGALDAVVEAFHPLATKSAAAESEADVLRWLLSKEQERVDKVLAKILSD